MPSKAKFKNRTESVVIDFQTEDGPDSLTVWFRPGVVLPGYQRELRTKTRKMLREVRTEAERIEKAVKADPDYESDYDAGEVLTQWRVEQLVELIAKWNITVSDEPGAAMLPITEEEIRDTFSPLAIEGLYDEVMRKLRPDPTQSPPSEPPSAPGSVKEPENRPTAIGSFA